MSFRYTQSLFENALTYDTYRRNIHDVLSKPAVHEAAEKMRPYLERNSDLMDGYDKNYNVSDALLAALSQAPSTTWLVITEGWCGDAAYNVPLLAAIERAVPAKVKLQLFLRDSNPELIDANLTDGGRSIPKLVVLDHQLKEVANWGPRPAAIHTLVKSWKSEGITLNDLIVKTHTWYEADHTRSLQEELITMVSSYS